MEPREQNDRVHEPVLVQEYIAYIHPISGMRYGDLTIGAGGTAEAVLEASAPDGMLFGLDQDPEILRIARERLVAHAGRLELEQGNFRNAAKIFSSYLGTVDGIVMDLGLSSYQLDTARRGFSIKEDGPLDFRMDPSQEFSAKDLVNHGSYDALLHAVGDLGEEPRAKTVVRAIIEARERRPLLHTSDLKSVIEQVYGRKGGRIHPATRAFQGIRMCVNREIESLEEGLVAAFRLLKPGGRLGVISFHSGEDRVVKQFARRLADAGQAEVITRKPIRPSDQEVRRNRRSRSARLRVLEKRDTESTPL